MGAFVITLTWSALFASWAILYTTNRDNEVLVRMSILALVLLTSFILLAARWFDEGAFPCRKIIVLEVLGFLPFATIKGPSVVRIQTKMVIGLFWNCGLLSCSLIRRWLIRLLPRIGSRFFMLWLLSSQNMSVWIGVSFQKLYTLTTHRSESCLLLEILTLICYGLLAQQFTLLHCFLELTKLSYYFLCFWLVGENWYSIRW